MISPLGAVLFRVCLTALLLVSATAASGYRPFISTDAAVADLNQFEIELGYFDLERKNRENSFSIPKVILNYGLLKDTELVAELRVERDPTAHWNVVDPGFSVKTVLKEGVLQEKEGSSIAVEAGPLLPSTIRGEKRFGFEGTGILSGQLAGMTYHINLGGGVDRANSDPFVAWGTILELPVVSTFRLVAEINGESVRTEAANNSALLGAIWQPKSSNYSLDVAVRKGITRAAPDWQFTTGLTFAFSVPFLGKP